MINKIYLVNLENPVILSNLTCLVAVPDFCAGAFLAALDAGALRDLLWITRRCLLYIPAFIFGNLGERTAGEDRNGRELRHFFFSRVVIAMLDQQPLSIARPHEHPRAF